MNYEIESKLREKADKWEVNSIAQKADSLNREVIELRAEKERLENRLSNQSQAINTLIEIIADKTIFEEDVNQLLNLKGYL